MNLNDVLGPVRARAFRLWRWVVILVPGPSIAVFGGDTGQIGAIAILNLDRQPRRWARVIRELGRFKTSNGERLTCLVERIAAVDARDGLAVAASADVDPAYSIGDHLYVHPDDRLSRCFSADEPVRMTRQEVAVARSHVAVWKVVANGPHEHVLVLEDDIWFRPGAPAAIERGWRAALARGRVGSHPKLVYFSYDDAGGTAVREETSEDLFRPVRGLWFLSGYVLSREGAAALLRAMPVGGPVDLWMNYRFAELDVLALGTSAIAQRPDSVSDNAYSMLPYLARAGVIDSRRHVSPPDASHVGPVLAWSGESERESLAMALSMLGLRVATFDVTDDALRPREVRDLLETFDALVDAPGEPGELVAAVANLGVLFLIEAESPVHLAPKRALGSVVVVPGRNSADSWKVLCGALGLPTPAEEFPAGALRSDGVFRAPRVPVVGGGTRSVQWNHRKMDASPWVSPQTGRRQPARNGTGRLPAPGPLIAAARMTEPSDTFRRLTETFPGNLASFTSENVSHDSDGTHLLLEALNDGAHPYRSGALASMRPFGRGRFEADIRPAIGPGLITGFFLHRDSPRQEIDIEFPGDDPRRMLVNVFFNPGDEGAAMSFGYRGSPFWIDLGFDATQAFHRYAIEWRSDKVAWSVDGMVVHERVTWDPTPIPHLEMRLHGNLWAPRSTELAGRLSQRALPATAAFRDIAVHAQGHR